MAGTSGDMWETVKDSKVVAGDGSDAGLAYYDFEKGQEPVLHFATYKYGERAYRVYDMNEVAKAYRNEPAIRIQQQKYPQHKDYGDGQYKNMVLVNYWHQKPGDVVELYENGRKLRGENSKLEDPTYNFAWDVEVIHGKIDKGAHKSNSMPYVWEFVTRSSKTPVTLIIKDKEGIILHQETFTRPIPFDPTGKSEPSIYPVQ